MPRISKEEAEARRNEVIDSCARLYEVKGYHDITMAQIAEGVSFGRANIYNYFSCKDEAMLALLQREHERWADDLDELAIPAPTLDDKELAEGLARSLEARTQMLKLLAMNLYDMEQNSRPEALVRLKVSYARVLSSLTGVLKAARPHWDEARIVRFTFSFMPFLHGVYPYSHHTAKQLTAMREAGVNSADLSASDMIRTTALQLLSAE